MKRLDRQYAYFEPALELKTVIAVTFVNYCI